MKLADIEQIRKETCEDLAKSNSVLKDKRIIALIKAWSDDNLTSKDIVLQTYLIGYEDRMDES